MTPLTPEQKAPQHIDAALDAVGWVVQDRSNFDYPHNQTALV